jgi:hypothetical protein
LPASATETEPAATAGAELEELVLEPKALAFECDERLMCLLNRHQRWLGKDQDTGVPLTDPPRGGPAEPGALQQNVVAKIVRHESRGHISGSKEMIVIRGGLKLGSERDTYLLTVALKQPSEALRDVAVEVVSGHAGSSVIGHDPVVEDGLVPTVESQSGANDLLGQFIVESGLFDQGLGLLEVAGERPDRHTVALEASLGFAGSERIELDEPLDERVFGIRSHSVSSAGASDSETLRGPCSRNRRGRSPIQTRPVPIGLGAMTSHWYACNVDRIAVRVELRATSAELNEESADRWT